MSENQTQCLQDEVWGAAREGQTGQLKAILENIRKEIASEILNHHTNEDGRRTTPLIISVIQANEEVVNTLIAFGVNLEMKGVVTYE